MSFLESLSVPFTSWPLHIPARLFTLIAVTSVWVPHPPATAPLQQSQAAAPAAAVTRLHARYEAPPRSPLAAPSKEGGCGAAEDVEDVNLDSGELRLSFVDVRIPGRGLDFVWGRTYRSRLGRETAIGHGWDYSYDISIAAEGNDVRLFDGNGRSDVYRRRPDGTFVLREFFREGRFNPDGSFTLTFCDSGRWEFRSLAASPAPGKLQSISDRNGNTLQFFYGAAGELTQIVDTLGRSITVAHTGNRITSITDFAGRTWSYAYYQPGDAGGEPGDLKSMTTPPVVGVPTSPDVPLCGDFPAGKRTTYTYSTGFVDRRLDHNLLTITDPKGQTWMVNEYGTSAGASFDRVVRQTRGYASDTLEIVYEPLAPAAAPVAGGGPVEVLLAIVNDRVGNVREYTFDERGRRVRAELFTGRAANGTPTTSSSNRPGPALRASDPPSFVTSYEFNDDSLVTRVVHPEGNVSRNVYEVELAPNAPWRTRGNLRERRREPGTHPMPGDQPAGTVELFEHQTGYGGCCGSNFVTRHTDARGHVTEHDYDAFGNRLQTRHPIAGIVDDWTYNGFGQVTSHTFPGNGGPANYRRRDEFTYYVPADGCQNGYRKQRIDDAATLARTTTYAYDCVGNLVSSTNPRGFDTQYAYDSLNNRVRELSAQIDTVVTPFRIEKRFFHDANDALCGVAIENRDENGTLDAANPWWTTRFEYDVLDRRTATIAEVDATRSIRTEVAYDGNGNRVLERSGAATSGAQPDAVVAHAYDERDLPFVTTRGAGGASATSARRDYDGNRNVVTLLEGLEDGPHATTYAYDAFDRCVQIVDALGNTSQRHFDPNDNLGGRAGGDASALHPFAQRVLGQLLDGEGSSGNVRLSEVMYEYDALDRRVRGDVRHFDTETQAAIDDGDATTTYAYNGLSQLVTVTGDLPGHTLSFGFDTLSRKASGSDASLNSEVLLYDENGNLVSHQRVDRADSGAGSQVFVETYSYDALDRLDGRSTNGGNIETYSYDSLDRRVRSVDPRGRPSRYVYDGLDRLLRIERDANGNASPSDPGDLRLEQQFDDSSRLESRQDGEGNETRYAYDACDRRIVTQLCDGTLEQVGTGATWPLGQPQPNLSSFTSGYDVHGNALERRDPNGSRTATVYDALDRPLNLTVTRGPNVLGTTSETYQYDGLSRWIRAQNNDSVVTRGGASTSGYDSLGNVLRETQQLLPGGSPRTVVSAYDGESNLLRLTYPSGRAIDYAYDATDRVRTLADAAAPGANIAAIDYVGPDRLERRTNGNGTQMTRTYDGISGVPNAPGDFGWRQVRTLQHTRGGSTLDSRAFAYDRGQNKLVGGPRTYGYDALSRLATSEPTGVPAQRTTYSLDLGTDRTQVTGPVDPGSYTSSCLHTLPSTPFDTRTYDANGNLRTSTNPATTYSYDFRNRLVQIVRGATTSTYAYDCFGRRLRKIVGGSATEHVYSGRAEIEEHGQTSLVAIVTTWVYGENWGSPLQMQRGSDVFYYHEDDLGSPRVLTDASGNVRETLEYGDFGKPTVTVAPPTPFTLTQPSVTNGSTVQSDSTPMQGNNLQVYAADDVVVAQTSILSAIQWRGAYQPGTTSPTSAHEQPPAGSCVPSDVAPNHSGFGEWCADDFTLSQPWQLTRVTWRGAYDFPATPPAGAGSFTVTLYHDAGGLPGAATSPPLVLGTIQRTSTGQFINGYQYSGLEEFEFTAPVNPPLQLAAGVRYWLRIAGNTASWPPGSPNSGGWVWERGFGGNGSGARFQNYAGNPGWFFTSDDTAFRLDLQGAPTPEPSPPASDNFSIELRADNGGTPGAIVASYAPGNAVARTTSGNAVFAPNGSPQPEYRYSYAIPAGGLTLGPGRYWLSIYDGTTTFQGTWCWGLSSGATSSRALQVNGGGWSVVAGDHVSVLAFTTGGAATGNPLAFRGMRHDAESGLLCRDGRALDPRTGTHLQLVREPSPAFVTDLANRSAFRNHSPLVRASPGYASSLNGELLSLWTPVFDPEMQESGGKSSGEKLQNRILVWTGVVTAIKTLWEGILWFFNTIFDLLVRDCKDTTVSIDVSTSETYPAAKFGDYDEIAEQARQDIVSRLDAACANACNGECHTAGQTCKSTSWKEDEGFKFSVGYKSGVDVGEGMWKFEASAKGTATCKCECK